MSNPTKLVIAGAMYFNESASEYFKPIQTGEFTFVEGHPYKKVLRNTLIDTFNGDLYTNDIGDKYYYDGIDTVVVNTNELHLVDNIDDLIQLIKG